LAAKHGGAAMRIARTRQLVIAFAVASLWSGMPTPAAAQTKEALAKDPNLFLTFAKRQLKWEERADPTKIVGPIHFVGTKGLGVWLITTKDGHILLNTALPTSG